LICSTHAGVLESLYDGGDDMVAAGDRRIYGVDFSGAKDAGRRIWIARGVSQGDSLRIDACYRTDALPGSGRKRAECLVALRDFTAGQKASAFGFDFPFGLPRPLVEGKRGWEDFVLSFPDDYPNPDAFRGLCREAAGGRELKRITDVESKTPFSPYNLRLYRQTYFGIRDVLYPLVQDQLACVLPMQADVDRASDACPDRPWILEICPASTLKREGLYRPYKGRSDVHRLAREWVLDQLDAREAVCVPADGLRSMILDDRGGDALDSVIAALATYRALRDPQPIAVEDSAAYALEGFVYV
jgi:hypothetical protein